MPDIGGLGKGLLKGALAATEKAAERVKDATGAATRKLADDDQVAAKAVPTPSDVAAAPGGSGSPEATPMPSGSAQGDPAPVPTAAGASRHGAAAADPTAASVDEPDSADEPDPPDLADEPDEQADASEVRELVEMFQRLLARRRPPEGPVQDEWSFGLGDLLAEHPKVPKKVRGIVGRLNRFGGLTYSPQEIVFDGEDVPWEKVTELRTRHIVDYLVGDAVEQQVENLPLPWFPGRKRLVDALGQAILTVTIATAKNQLEKVDLDLRIPAEVAYKASFGRTKELGAGVLSAMVLADPAVNASVIATARARGIPVSGGDDELLADADERAAKIQEKIAALEKELDKFTKRFGRLG